MTHSSEILLKGTTWGQQVLGFHGALPNTIEFGSWEANSGTKSCLLMIYIVKGE